jgi:hypothetical protein
VRVVVFRFLMVASFMPEPAASADEPERLLRARRWGERVQ